MHVSLCGVCTWRKLRASPVFPASPCATQVSYEAQYPDVDGAVEAATSTSSARESELEREIKTLEDRSRGLQMEVELLLESQKIVDK